jgi:predicted Zn-dependent protease
MLPEPSLDELRLEETLSDPDSRERVASELRDIATSFSRRSTGRAGRLVDSVDLVPVTDDLVDFWLAIHPDHPDLLELAIDTELRRNRGEPSEAMIPLLESYAKARPVDPMPHRHLASLYLSGDDPSEAIPHLEYLDAREQYKPVYAAELARRYADERDWDMAHKKATRTVQVAPYDGNYRELAATIAIRRGDLAEAEHHIETLTKLEPTIPQHAKRLEAIRAMRAQRGE